MVVSFSIFLLSMLAFNPICKAQNNIKATKNYSDSINNRSPFLNLTEEQLLNISGHSIKDSIVQFLLHSKYCNWVIDPGNEKKGTWYRDCNNALELFVYKDEIIFFGMFNTYKDKSGKTCVHYKGKLPYGLTFDMKRSAIEKIFNEPAMFLDGHYISHNKKRTLWIDFNGDDPNSSTIKEITLFKE